MSTWISFLLLAVLSCSPFARVSGQSSEEKYLQDVRTEVTLPSGAGKNVLKLFSTLQSAIAVTSNGVFRYRNGSWTGKPNGGDWQTATIDKQGKVWLADVNSIQQENSAQKLILPEPVKNDTILTLFWEDGKTLHVGTTRGLIIWDGKWNAHPEIKARVNAVVSDAQKQLWVATTDGLWRRSSGKWVNMDETMMDRGNGRNYFTLSQQKEGAEILLSTPYSVGCISETGNNWVLRASDGLPWPGESDKDCRWRTVVRNRQGSDQKGFRLALLQWKEMAARQ